MSFKDLLNLIKNLPNLLDKMKFNTELSYSRLHKELNIS